MSACVILQSMSRLKAAYKDNADTITANCDSVLFLGSTELPTLEWVSKMLGKETIDTQNFSVSQGQTGSYSRSEQKTGRELMTPDELRIMPGGECILLLRGVKPFKSRKYNIKGHTNYPKLANGDVNRFKAKAYIARHVDKKAVISSGDSFEFYSFDVADTGSVPGA